ncbi:MAG: glycosyltransferase family 4 protein [Candidatus Gracilibacteria bacterium]|jgi:glycosyltransferase involved in cell wall biosynthesis|nr:glycosyltransferase family 4 protein [Candidatus Gracilibacteria bacterium]
MKVNQFVSNFCFGDAISNNVRILKNKFFEKGISGEIYTQFPDEFSSNESRFFREYEGNSENVLIMHGSTYSEIFDFIKTLPDKKVLIYHNITPPDFFRGYSDFFVEHLNKGLLQVRSLSEVFDLALGVSEFNCKNLREMGFQNVQKVPLYIDFSKYSDSAFDSSLGEIFSRKGKNILFVGRMAPNKKQEDIIKVFYLYRKYFDINAHLILAGDFAGMEEYYGRILALISELSLERFVKITGKVSDFDLNYLYRNCDLFLSMSEHEGFFVPVIESFYFNLPVMAYRAGAVSETMGDGGIIFDSKDFISVAENMNKIFSDLDFRTKLLSKQKSSLSNFISSNDDFKILELVRNL